MGLQAVPGFLGADGLEHPVELFRNWTAAMAGRRTGALRFNDFSLTGSASSMQMVISSGSAVVMGSEQTTQGGYFVWSNANETISWPAAAGSPRVDSLVLRIIDTDYGSDPSLPQAMWEVVSGTPAGSPVEVPDVEFASGGDFYRPGAWWRVANFQVPSGATNLAAATISHKRLYARIGRHTMALTNPSDAQRGERNLNLTDGLTYEYNGTTWLPVDAGVTPIRAYSNGSSSAVISETVVQTVTSSTYKANRAYQVWVGGGYNMSAAAAFCSWNLRKTDINGALVISFPRVPAPGFSGLVCHLNLLQTFVVGGSDVTTSLALCSAASGGSVIHHGDASNPRHVSIRDVGPASAWPGSPTLT